MFSQNYIKIIKHVIRRPSKNALQKHTEKMNNMSKTYLKMRPIFFVVFLVCRGLGPRVPQGGPKDPPRTLKVSPKVPSVGT